MIRHIFLDKTATLIKGSQSNTGLNPVAELNYGDAVTRFILHFDESEIKAMVDDKTVANLDKATFVLNMTNCSAINGIPYEKPLHYGNTCGLKERASSFDILALELDRDFDAGRGYEFVDDTWVQSRKAFSMSGCNWFQASNGLTWESDGVYSAEYIEQQYQAFSAGTSGNTRVIGRQHFDFGDEQLQIDITDYVRAVVREEKKNHGILICFSPNYETLHDGAFFREIDRIPDGVEYKTYESVPSTKDATVPEYFEVVTRTYYTEPLPDPCSTGETTATTTATTAETVAYYQRFIKKVNQQYVGFFTENTNTFFHPYVEMVYDGIIKDDRECFYPGKENKLYLYSNIGGKPENLDTGWTCTVDCGEVVNLEQVTKGVYCATVKVPIDAAGCMCTDTWSGISYDGTPLDDVELEAPVQPAGKYFQVGSSDVKHEHLVPQVYGINDDENVTQNEVREVVVDFRRKYTTNERQTIADAWYRLYVKDGERQIDIFGGYVPVERSFLHNYFLIYTMDLIPNNKYYVDIKILDGREERFYEDVLHFRIVDDVTERYA